MISASASILNTPILFCFFSKIHQNTAQYFDCGLSSSPGLAQPAGERQLAAGGVQATPVIPQWLKQRRFRVSMWRFP